MGVIRKTISYLKRNGIADTWYAVRERTDKGHMDKMSRYMLDYKGREQPGGAVIKAQRERRFQKEYTFSILVPAYETDGTYLAQMIESVLNQTYQRLELIIADASAGEKVENVVRDYKDARIRYIRLEENKGISANTNEALTAAEGDYIGLLDHDDVLTVDALYEVMCLLQDKEYSVIYTDEDKTDGGLKRFYEPNIKPQFNFDLLLSNNYICHFMLMKRELIKSLLFRPEYDGAQDYDLVLRAVAALIHREGTDGLQYMHRKLRETIGHVPKVLYHWRCHEASTAANPESKRYAYEAGLRALNGFIDCMGWDAAAAHSRHLGFYSIDYHGSIWQIREDVAAVGGRVTSGGIVTGSPVLEDGASFLGLHEKYSGYLHRAGLYMDMDELCADCIKIRDGLSMTLEEAKKKGMCLLYDPSFVKTTPRTKKGKI